MSKGSLFTIGVMSGIIVVLACALFVQTAPPSYAQSAMGDGSSGLVVATGGLLSSTNDLFWVLYKRPPSEAEKKLLGKNFDGDRLTLCTYRAISGGGATGQGRLLLIAARDITFDLKMVGLDTDTIKSVKEIKKAYEDALKQADKDR